MKNLKELKRMLVLSFLLLTSTAFNTSQLSAQQVEVQGELKVTQMTADDTQESLVIHNGDGTFGSRSVSSLPPPPPPIDTLHFLSCKSMGTNSLTSCMLLVWQTLTSKGSISITFELIPFHFERDLPWEALQFMMMAAFMIITYIVCKSHQ